MEKKLLYRKQASGFAQASPLGNGRIGAMIYGECIRERISLNEDTFWSGYPRTYTLEGSADSYQKAGELVSKGDFQGAYEEINHHFLSEYSEAYLPVGDIFLDFNHKDVVDYQRILNLEKGNVTVSYQDEGIHFQREYFCSEPHQILAVRIQADKPGKLTFKVTMDSKMAHIVRAVGEPEQYRLDKVDGVKNGNSHGRLIMDLEAPGHVRPYYGTSTERDPFSMIYEEEKEKRGMGCRVVLWIESDGDILTRGEKIEELCVEGAGYAIIYIGVGTSFNGYDVHPQLYGKDYKSIIEKQLNAAMACGYNQVKKTHEEDFEELFNRVSFGLGNEAYGKEGKLYDAEELFRQYEESGEDLKLSEIIFDMGRYLLISASRSGTQPTNLQGIWNESARPVWSCNYTTNINMEMNYWPVMGVNLGELFQPLEVFVKEAAVTGRAAAVNFYGADGFVIHHNSDIWRLTTPVGARKVKGGPTACFWYMAGGWLAAELWEKYLYNQDLEYLKDTVYPLLKSASQFYLSVQQEENGFCFLSPDTSPENSFIHNGQKVSVAKWTTMSNAVLRDLYTAVCQAAEELDDWNETVERAKSALEKLPAYQIGSKGQLLEWNEEFKEAEVRHRHVSHLYGLYPGHSITEKDPELMEAVRVSMELRGDEGTGWSLAWKTAIWARLKERDRAAKLLHRFLRVERDGGLQGSERGGICPNFFCTCPPMQIDGNFGITAAILEMLVQTEGDKIWILPAVPENWTCGFIKGICIRGGLQLDLEWEQGEKVKAIFYPKKNCTRRIYCGGREETVNFTGGISYEYG